MGFSKKYFVQTFFVFVFLLLASPVFAEQYHTTLLTVSQEGENGGTADLFLELQPGTGRVFIDSYPVSRADTQFSTRFAKEVACDFLQVNCNRYDFFYTIRTRSSIVGGPSAGAAVAVLTVAALDGQRINQDVAMTGTINSGGVIGPVAGILAKVEAAREKGISTVVIPSLSPLILEQNVTNASEINISTEQDEEIINNLTVEGFEVVQATDLYDALPYFINKEYAAPDTDIPVPESYLTIMELVSEDLCSRHETLREETQDFGNETNRTIERSQEAIADNEFYAAASFCFSDSIRLQRELLMNESDEELLEVLQDTERKIFLLDKELKSRNLSTIADIETYAIVRERLVEAREELLELNASNISSTRLSYIVERTNSAYSWSEFFAMESKEFNINEAHLSQACSQKIAEAEERITYIESFLPERFTGPIRDDLRIARRDFATDEFAVCLFKASKTKAEANILASVLSVNENRLPLLAQEKLNAVERVLARQSERGLFPIMGYSYLEYGSSLVESDPYSALTFAEYALEVGNLHLYFPPEDEFYFVVDWELLMVFFSGVITGLAVFYFILRK